MAVGNMIKMQHLLDRRWYEKTLDPEDFQEAKDACHRLALLHKWLAEKYTIAIDGQLYHPYALLRFSLLTFLAALV